MTPRIVYKAEVTNDKNQTTFKERHRNHTKSFNNKKYLKETELSKYIWSLKEDNKTRSIKRSILKSIKTPLNSISCVWCLSEKSFIINSLNECDFLNKKSEFVSKCIHQRQCLLSSIKYGSKD